MGSVVENRGVTFPLVVTDSGNEKRKNVENGTQERKKATSARMREILKYKLTLELLHSS